MFRRPSIALLVLLLVPLSAPGQEATVKYRALLQEFNAASRGIREASTDLERNAVVERLAALPNKFASLAEEYPQDPVVLQVLRQAIQSLGTADSIAQVAWETNRADFPDGCKDDSTRRIIDVLMRHHIQSDRLSPICGRMRYGYRLEFEGFLTAVLEKNPHREVQGVACLSLAQFLNDRMRMLQLVEDRPELVTSYKAVFGENYLANLKRLGQSDLSSRIESLLERAVNDYDDVKVIGATTVGARAKSELYKKLIQDAEVNDK